MIIEIKTTRHLQIGRLKRSLNEAQPNRWAFCCLSRAALRLRTIREIGKWCWEHINHSGGDPSPEETGTWKNIGIHRAIGNDWMTVSKIPGINTVLFLKYCYNSFMNSFIERDVENGRITIPPGCASMRLHER